MCLPFLLDVSWDGKHHLGHQDLTEWQALLVGTCHVTPEEIIQFLETFDALRRLLFERDIAIRGLLVRRPFVGSDLILSPASQARQPS